MPKVPHADDDWNGQEVVDRTDRLCFVVERDGRVDTDVYVRLHARRRQVGAPPSSVVYVPMPLVDISTANFFLLDRHRMLQLIYS